LFSAFIALVGITTALEWTAMVAKGDKKQQYAHILAAIIASFAPFIPFASPILLALAAIAVIWVLSVVMAMRQTEHFRFKLNHRAASAAPAPLGRASAGPNEVRIRRERNKTRSVSGVAGNALVNKWLVFGVPYIALPMLALVLLRADHGINGSAGLIAIVVVFASVWTADTLAYFFGRSFGGPKLMPTVSPNKTWSGFFGAVLGGLLATVLVFYFAGLNNLLAAALIGAAIGGLEQGGDLYESAAKRKFGIKDSGTIIPGHGGVLDRVDGLMAAAIAAWVFGAISSGNWQTAATGLLNWSL